METYPRVKTQREILKVETCMETEQSQAVHACSHVRIYKVRLTLCDHKGIGYVMEIS